MNCSFCKKHPDDVMNIIAGDDVYICDECVVLCNRIIIQEAQKRYKKNNLDRTAIFNEYWPGG